MSPPDLSTKEGRAAYRRELRWVAWPWRASGLGLVALGALTVLFAHADWLVTVGYVCLGVGWAALLVALVQRNRYHRRRLSGG